MLRPKPGAIVRLLSPPPPAAPAARANPTFPLEFHKRRKGVGYYLALAVVGVVFSSTWVAAAWIVWYAVRGKDVRGVSGVLAFIGLVVAVAEVLFFLYQRYIISIIQRPAPPSTLTPDECRAFFIKMLQTGMTDDAGGAESVPSASEIQERLEDAIDLVREDSPSSTDVSEDPASSATTVVDTSSPTLRHRKPSTRTNEASSAHKGTGTPMVKLHRLASADPRAIEFREKMRNWFGRRPWDTITRPVVLHWLAWSCCNLSYAEASRSPVQMTLLEASLDLLEARTGTTFPDPDPEPAEEDTHVGRLARGRVRDVGKLMRLTLDPVNTRTRPLGVYAARAGMDWWLKRGVYRRMGFEVYREGDLEYLLRIPPEWTPEKQDSEGWDPIVYIHGLGFGLVSLQNIHVLQSLVHRLPHNPLIVPIQPHISMHIFHPRHLKPPSRGETTAAIRAICARWGFWPAERLSRESLAGHNARGSNVDSPRRGIVVFSHSNGSIAHGWLIKDCPEMILRSALVDPVVFCLWEGDVCYNFCYREPHNTIELLLHWFIASEIGIATSIQRHFDWSANTLFHDEIPHAHDPRRTLVVLGGEDVIIDAWRVKGYLNRHGMRESIVFDSLANHGEGLRGDALERIIKFLKGQA
ncbi:hypothetical protein NliqN6_5130 [Naganishia liquefaciens]|uniref:Alpha/beta hydrolase n=1 Tax=Naganishia liquefaciens TaxID=104408 RepID=A0A8H3TXN5_9TREE|nr:hypothetical protein NliqN6_5130 [Naganishia liquefaciens]